MYNYLESMKKDIIDYLRDTYTAEEIREKVSDSDERDEWMSGELYDTLWTEDSVTGNASGSYTFSRATARECVLGSEDILADAVEAFGIKPSEVGEKFLSEDWEWFDVTIRCYLLGDAIREAVEEVEKEFSI